MKINILTIYYALGTALLAARIHEVFANTHFEVDDFQVDVDQEVDIVSCYLVVDTTINLVHLLSTPHAHILLVSVTILTVQGNNGGFYTGRSHHNTQEETKKTPSRPRKRRDGIPYYQSYFNSCGFLLVCDSSYRGGLLGDSSSYQGLY
jgi:hypothetical protein